MSRPTIAVLEAMRPDNTKVYAEELDTERNGGKYQADLIFSSRGRNNSKQSFLRIVS